MNEKIFKEKLDELNINYDEEKLSTLEKYYLELVSYNEKVNLTAITKKEDVYLKHFYDSLTITKVIDLNEVDNLLDIGSGAGFPGLVLKIFYPNLNVTLIDSNNKKTIFLAYISQKLGLKNVIVINDRVENFAKNNLNSFDVVTARAVTQLNILSELAMPLVKKNKYFIAMKGNVDSEFSDGAFAITKMHGEILDRQEFYLNENDNKRTLILIRKNSDTELKELRSYDKIVKKPLQKGK